VLSATRFRITKSLNSLGEVLVALFPFGLPGPPESLIFFYNTIKTPIKKIAKANR